MAGISCLTKQKWGLYSNLKATMRTEHECYVALTPFMQAALFGFRDIIEGVCSRALC